MAKSNFRFVTAACMVAVLLLASCKEKVGSEQQVNLTKTEITVNPNGGVFSAQVESLGDVTVSIEPGSEWISNNNGTKAAEYNKTTFSFRAEANTSENERVGKILFSCQNDVDTLYVRQSSCIDIINTTDTLRFLAKGGTQEVRISSNFDFKITCSDNWVEATEATAKAEYKESTILVTAKANNDQQPREALVILSSENGVKADTIQVYQEGFNKAYSEFLEKSFPGYYIWKGGNSSELSYTRFTSQYAYSDKGEIKTFRITSGTKFIKADISAPSFDTDKDIVISVTENLNSNEISSSTSSFSIEKKESGLIYLFDHTNNNGLIIKTE